MKPKHTVEIVTITIEVITTGIIAYLLWRSLMGPDTEKRVVMRVFKSSENFAEKQAQSWAHIADHCRKVYDAQRSVTV